MVGELPSHSIINREVGTTRHARQGSSCPRTPTEPHCRPTDREALSTAESSATTPEPLAPTPPPSSLPDATAPSSSTPPSPLPSPQQPAIASSSTSALSDGDNAMSQISRVPLLDGSNYGRWREKVELALAMSKIDMAIKDPCPVEPAALVRGTEETEAAFASCERDNASVIAKYDLDKAKWKQSNRKCLMMIKRTVMESIRRAIPEVETATEYLSEVESEITGASELDKDACLWCQMKGHSKKDCPSFLKHLLIQRIPYEPDAAKRRKKN